MASLQQLRVADPVLTQLAYGYHNSEHVGEILMPIVEIDKEAGKIPKFGRESFRVRSTVRQPRAGSNEITPEDIGAIDVVLDEHDLAFPVDYREEHEAAFALKSYALGVVQDGISLVREKQIADLVYDDIKYATSNKVALTGTDKFSDPSSDPFAVFDKAIMAVKRSIGHKPNSCVIPEDVFEVLKIHPKLIEKIKYVQKGILDEAALAALLGIPNLAIGSAVTADALDNLTDIWSKHVVLAYVPTKEANRRRVIYEPSFGYTVRRKGSLVADTYPAPGGKVTWVRCTDIQRPHLLGGDAGFLIKDAI